MVDQLIKDLVVQALNEQIPTLLKANSTTYARWVNIKQVAEHLRVSENFVRQNEGLRKLQHRPGGGDPRWDLNEVDAWVKSGGQSETKTRKPRTSRI